MIVCVIVCGAAIITAGVDEVAMVGTGGVEVPVARAPQAPGVLAKSPLVILTQ